MRMLGRRELAHGAVEMLGCTWGSQLYLGRNRKSLFEPGRAARKHGLMSEKPMVSSVDGVDGNLCRLAALNVCR